MRKHDVLLADDHAIIRDGLRQILGETDDLQAAGEAANAQQVLERLAEREWDVLVLDVSMPGRSGIDLIRQIRSDGNEIPILVLSMHDEEQYALRALKAGASGYLNKEADTEILLDAIRKVMRGGVYVSPAVAELMARDLIGGGRQRHQALSDREFDIFLKLAAGNGLTEIADELSISVKTVSTHKTRIMQKMEMQNLTDLVRYALKNRLIPAGEAE